MDRVCVEKLVEEGKRALADTPTSEGENFLSNLGERGKELLELLKLKNGFYAYSGALHVFPIGSHETVIDLKRWNDEKSWKKEFSFIDEDYFCFAEDIFGWQYCIVNDRIKLMDIEQGIFTEFAPDLETWAKKVLDDPDGTSGAVFAKGWAREEGGIVMGNRINVWPFFVLGGKVGVANYAEIEQEDLLAGHGIVARQLLDIEDGQQVRVELLNLPDELKPKEVTSGGGVMGDVGEK